MCGYFVFRRWFIDDGQKEGNVKRGKGPMSRLTDKRVSAQSGRGQTMVQADEAVLKNIRSKRVKGVQDSVKTMRRTPDSNRFHSSTKQDLSRRPHASWTRRQISFTPCSSGLPCPRHAVVCGLQLITFQVQEPLTADKPLGLARNLLLRMQSRWAALGRLVGNVLIVDGINGARPRAPVAEASFRFHTSI